MYRPKPDDPAGVWQAWVAANPDEDARYRRLAEVPTDLQPTVRMHLRTVQSIERFLARKGPRRYG